jgi:hypothetical protein
MSGMYPASRGWHGRVLCPVESESWFHPSAASLTSGTGRIWIGPAVIESIS